MNFNTEICNEINLKWLYSTQWCQKGLGTEGQGQDQGLGTQSQDQGQGLGARSHETTSSL